MDAELSLKEIQKAWHGSLRSYVIGFTASFLLTSLSFLLVAGEFLPAHVLIYVVSGLALVQAVFQLTYFLHLGEEGKPHWETAIFFFMLLILLIIVGGTVWIMHDLNVRTMRMDTEVVSHG